MPVIKGTSSISDDRVREKLLKKTKFPSNFKRAVQFNKIHRPVIVKWIQDRLTELQNGVEDEIVQQMAVNLFLPPEDAETDFNTRDKIQPKKAQLDLAGFLGDNEAAVFSKELWSLLLEAQETSNGIPPSLIARKKKELLEKQRPRETSSFVAPRQESLAPDPQMSSILQEAQRRAQAARAVLERQQVQQWQQRMQANQNQQQALLPRQDPRGVPPLAGMAAAGDLCGMPPMMIAREKVPPSVLSFSASNAMVESNDKSDNDDDKTVDLNEVEGSDEGKEKYKDNRRHHKKRRDSSVRDKSNRHSAKDRDEKGSISDTRKSDRRRNGRGRSQSPDRGGKRSRKRDSKLLRRGSESDASSRERKKSKRQNELKNRDRGKKLDGDSDSSSYDRKCRSRGNSSERESQGRKRHDADNRYKRRYSSSSSSSASSRSISRSLSRSRSRSPSSRRSRSLSSRSWSRSPTPSPRQKDEEDDCSLRSEEGRTKDSGRRCGGNNQGQTENKKKYYDKQHYDRNGNQYHSHNRDHSDNAATYDRAFSSGRGADRSWHRRETGRTKRRPS